MQMLVLFVVIAITGLMSRASDNRENLKLNISIVTVIIAVFSGLRSWWMGDLIKYYTLYTQCNGDNWVARVFDDWSNIGIRLFFRGMGALGISYDICIFVIAAFSAITLAILVFRYSPAPYWSYLMYIAMGFYLFTFSGLKQTIAMGFVVLATIGILENKPVKFLAWTIVAGAFHMPALIFLAAYPVAKQKINIRYFAVLIAAVIAVYVFRNQIVDFMSDAYYEQEHEYTVSKTVGGRMLMMVFIMVLAVILRPVNAGDKIYHQVFNLMVVAAIIQYFSIYDNVFTRLADYYYQLVVLFMPLMLENGEHQLRARPRPQYRVRCFDSWAYAMLYVGVTLFAVWFYKNTVDNSWAILKDYKFCWEIDPYALYYGN